MPGTLISALVIYTIKFFSLILYRTEARWLTPKEQIQWEELRMAVVLNHTSLFEPLFISAIPNYRLWRAIKRVTVPIADVTMNRPFVGWLFRLLVPNAIAITRKRDDTWEQLVSRAAGDALIVIFPEGRMKRKDGLDKHGKPMSVKGGVADILSRLENGKMLICYSGGLHHVQAPGEFIPRIFQKICITFEQVDIAEYKRSLDKGDLRRAAIADLESRMAQYC